MTAKSRVKKLLKKRKNKENTDEHAHPRPVRRPTKADRSPEERLLDAIFGKKPEAPRTSAARQSPGA